jgi:hypothetical protein
MGSTARPDEGIVGTTRELFTDDRVSSSGRAEAGRDDDEEAMMSEDDEIEEGLPSERGEFLGDDDDEQ